MPRSLARRLKRVVDVSCAATGLVLLSPVFAATAFATWATLGVPIFFRQSRPGRGGRPFTIFKFRTMRSPRPGEVWFKTDAQRLTSLGRFLRTTSIDELPELWNVLRGDMSLVGPRPLLTDYLDVYSAEERRRHDVLPGITGLAVVHGRNTVPFRERLALDVWYVDHWSLWLDLQIMARTALLVLRRSGAVATEDGTGLGFPMDRVEHLDATAGAGAPKRAGAPPATAPGRGAGASQVQADALHRSSLP